ncbi:alkyl/aryl-sulfatase [Phenylobacterium terrae]|uniref:Alkyl/aryl-sulfatase n=1 Tax=Phenylobacterium terrae TaxID=2665495 RepID=A0ABW4N2Y5_9CAUL
MRLRFILATALAGLALPAAAEPTAHTTALQAQAAAAPEFADRTDYDFAARGFLGTRTDPVIRSAAGGVAWDLRAYDFLKGEAPASVHPALWRQSQLLAKHGLFEVVDGVYQVRGFDLANVTFIRGRRGWIVIDPLGSAETAKAAYELVTETLGARPVTAVVYTHSHSDHFNGAGGLVSPEDAAAGRVKVIAPEGFMEAVASENILAGPAMARRAVYQFGVFLPRGPEGQVGAGIGPGLSRGTPALVAPNTIVTASSSRLTVDGVEMEFQLTPETEAPAEMNIYLPGLRVLCMAENANATMHNVLTPRGALVRDAKAWADQLTASLRLYGDRSDVMFTSHAWPRWGREEVKSFLARHRDAYKFLHDQTVRLMNQGLTGEEIAERLTLPPELAREWYNKGFYGNVSFNSRAVYQRYMGWYEGNPVQLAPLPPERAATRYVEAMGGPAAVTARARAAFEAGDYAWAAELLDKLVFAGDPTPEAKALLAESYRQLGYQSESSLWRNMYLSAADELASAPKGGPGQPGLLASAPLPLMLDAIAVRLDPAKAAGGELALQIVLTDEPGKALLKVANGVLVHEPVLAPSEAQAVLKVRRADLAGLFTGTRKLADLQAAGHAELSGDPTVLTRLAAWIERPAARPFPIVTP